METKDDVKEVIKAREALDNRKEAYENLCGLYEMERDVAFYEDIKTLEVLVDRDEAKPVNRLHPLKAFGKCPVCNESVHLRHHRQFCGECGNRLVWSNNKGETQC